MNLIAHGGKQTTHPPGAKLIVQGVHATRLAGDRLPDPLGLLCHKGIGKPTV